MTVATDIPQLYRARPINVWVEDAFSKTYFREVWNDPQIAFHIAGSKDGVQVASRQAEAERLPAVFGVVDRDFGRTDRAKWLNAGRTSRLFRLPVHEAENYLIDAAALHRSGADQAGIGEAEIDAKLRERAAELTWWAACGAVMTDLRREVTADFPTEPPKPPPKSAEPVADLDHAVRHICDSPWFAALGSMTTTFDEENEVQDRLTDRHTEFHTVLSNADWRVELPGKELLTHVVGTIWTAPVVTKAERDADIAKTVGAWQHVNGEVPGDLSDLHRAIRKLAGL